MITSSSQKKRSVSSRGGSPRPSKRGKTQPQTEAAPSDDLPPKDGKMSAKTKDPPAKKEKTSSRKAARQPAQLAGESKAVASKPDESAAVLTDRPKFDTKATATPQKKPRNDEPVRIVTPPKKKPPSPTTQAKAEVKAKVSADSKEKQESSAAQEEKEEPKRSRRLPVFSTLLLIMVCLIPLFVVKFLPKPDCLFGVLFCNTKLEIFEDDERNCTIGEDGECMAPPRTNVFSSETLVSKEEIPLFEGKPFSATNVRNAAEEGHVGVLSGMLARKPEYIDLQDSKGWAPIHLATRRGHTLVVKYLLEAGCDAKRETNNGSTALQIALDKLGKNHPIVALLDDNGNDVSFTRADLRKAAQTGDLDALFEMIKAKPEWVNAQDDKGWAPIHLAVRGGHSTSVKQLIRAGCDMELETFSAHTPIAIAFNTHGQDHLVTKMLLRELPHVHFYNGKPFTAHTVRTAAESGDLEMVEGMLQVHADYIDKQDVNGWAPLHLATRGGHVDVVTFLVESGCDTDLKTNNGLDALHIAQERLGSEHAITILLQEEAE